MRYLKSWIPVLVLPLAFLFINGCEGDTETIQTTVDKFPECSATYPFGTCEEGKSCVAGVCVDPATLCSQANPGGACATGETCFHGTCLPEVLMCGTTNLTGLCDPGMVCEDGACVEPVAEVDACGPATPNGECPEAMTCLGGLCVADTQLCDVNNATGVCPIAYTCLDGACVATGTLCSGIKPDGVCGEGMVCQAGVCAPEEFDPCTVQVYQTQPTVVAHTDKSGKAILEINGLQFRDLNDDGMLNPYEDWRISEICRAEDLVSRMTMAEKIGTMGETSSMGGGTADATVPADVTANIVDNHRRYALIRLGQRTAAELAAYLNAVQELAETQPLGIPVTITADPVHGFGMSTDGNTGAQTLSAPTVVSPWPYPMGLGAANDRALTRQYGDVVRKEFMAMGFRWQLGPMADLATEPRWARVQNTFGENAMHVAGHVAACIEGFQGVGDGGLKNGIAATMKHFPGAGPDEDGKDSHSWAGRFNVYPGDNFIYHFIAFQAAIDAGVAAVMPCYSIFKDQRDYEPEQVGAGYSYSLITKLLKQKMGFTGMVTGDWGSLNQAYGAESVPIAQRAAMWVQAGSNQLGMDSETNFLAAYNAGYLTEEEIDGAVVKILEMTFKLGLFENPYVDATAASTIVRSEDNLMAGFNAQKKAIVMLRNRAHEFPPVVSGGFGPPPTDPAPYYLPIDGSRYKDANGNSAPDAGEYIDDVDGDGVIRVYYDGVVDGLVEDAEKPDAVTPFVGEYDYTAAATSTALAVVETDTLADADIAVLRITARKGVYFGSDAGYPLSFDGVFPGTGTDSTIAPAIKDRNRVLDAFRVRDGYVNAAGETIAATNPDLKIVIVMHMDRPGIIDPFVKGLMTLDETLGAPGSYPMISDPANTDATGLGGVDGVLVDFGAFDRAVLDFLFNKNQIAGWTYGMGRLPIEIPSTDAAVAAQYEDVPADSLNPTFKLGSGSSY